MKALTVRQPYAWAIIHGGKDVENRSTAWRYRGPLAIHAAARLDQQGRTDPDVLRAWNKRMHPLLCDVPNLTLGAIIGVVDLVGVHVERPRWSARTCWCESDWAQIDCFHLMLANPRPLATPVPYKGRQGLWDVPDELVADLQTEVA